MSANDLETLDKTSQSYLVPGLRRGLLVLEAVAEAQRPLTIAEIGRAIGITNSAVFRLTYTLRRMGFLVSPDNQKKFSLGPRVLNIGFAFLGSQEITETSREDLEWLRDKTNISAHLAIRDGRDVLILNCVQTRNGFLSNINVGARIPAYATPMGWLLLGMLSSREIAGLFKDSEFVVRRDDIPRSFKALTMRVAEATGKGFAVSRSMEISSCSIAAPVYDNEERITAAIDISGPAAAFGAKGSEAKYIELTLEGARRISARLGCPSSLRSGKALFAQRS